MCFQLSILTSFPFSLLRFPALTCEGQLLEGVRLVFDCLQKLFFVLVLLLLIVLEIVIYSYMWVSLYSSNCLEVSTTETLRRFPCVQSKSQGHLWRVLNEDDPNWKICSEEFLERVYYFIGKFVEINDIFTLYVLSSWNCFKGQQFKSFRLIVTLYLR